MICFPLFEGEQITQILLGLFLEIYFREYFSQRGRGVFVICFWINFEKNADTSSLKVFTGL